MDVFAQLAHLLRSQPWAIQPHTLSMLVALARRQTTIDAVRAEAPEIVAARTATGGVRAEAQPGQAVAIIPIRGVITPRASILSLIFGFAGGGLDQFRDSFRAALADEDVSGILLDIDSPGGSVSLVSETSAEIRGARGAKPIVAIANTMAASAAYSLASQADEVVVTPSGFAGSIGVYNVHDDWSKFNEDFGVVPTYVFAGDHKIDGHPDAPLSEEARADMQADVNAFYDLFVNDVAAGRGVSAKSVRDGYGQGRTLTASRALAEGLVDRIATFEQVVAGMLSPPAGRSSQAMHLEEVRRAALAQGAAPATTELGLEPVAPAVAEVVEVLEPVATDVEPVVTTPPVIDADPTSTTGPQLPAWAVLPDPRFGTR